LTIKQLIPDIYNLVKNRNGWFSEDLSRSFSLEVAQKISGQFNRPEQPSRLRLSQMGQRCPCALWHSIHRPELAEAFSAPNLIKFSHGHIVEAEAIMLAKAAGHLVTGEQDELDVLGVKGHRDCVIDGHIVDVKSCNSRTFANFENGDPVEINKFGYLDQLDGYMVGSADDDLVFHKDVAYLFGVDLTLGKMVLYEHHLRKAHILARVASNKAIVALDVPPACTCEEVSDGESGNYILGVNGSYNPYKWVCKPNLRCFIYSGGPRFFTRVVKIPKHKGNPLIEVDKHGRRVYTN
jgi:hypothetical protein